MSTISDTVAAAEFKSHCLQLMEQVRRFHKPIVITKHGKPIAKLIPYEVKQQPIFGCMKNTVTINHDIVGPLDLDWEADE